MSTDKSYDISIIATVYLVLLISSSESTTIEIINKLPDDLRLLDLRCQSKNTDLGNHTLYQDQTYSWQFTAGPTTLWFCHFYWNQKDVNFNVYDHLYQCFCNDCATDDCYYQARGDGFYFNQVNEVDPNEGWKLVKTWG